MIQQEKQYAALAPIMALAGVFAHPAASTILPLILFFIFNWRKLNFARLVALRAADLAFSVQLYLIVASALLVAIIYFNPMTDQQAHSIYSNITLVAVAYLIISLGVATIQSFREKAFKHVLSLKIAERVFFARSKS